MTEIDVPVPREHHQLPSGASVEMLAVTVLKAKHFRQVVRAISDMEGRFGGQALDLLDGVVAMLVVSWTVTGGDGEILPIPQVHIDSIEELDLEDYTYLIGLPVVKNTAAKVMESQRPVDSPDGWDDPMSPSGPSSAPRRRLGAATSSGPAATTGVPKSKTSGGRSAGAGRRSK